MQSSRTTLKDRVGHCYELAYKALQEGMTLCQGYLHFEGACIHHAWIERECLVYDAVFDRIFPKGEYYTVFAAQEVVQYSMLESRRQALDTGHYGPWTPVDESRLKTLSKGEG